MLKQIILPAAAAFIILASSCGPNKKLQAAKSELESAHNEINQLEKKNQQLSQSIDALKTDFAAIDNRNRTLVNEFTNYKKSCEENEEKLAVMREILTEEAQNLDRLEQLLDSALDDFSDRGVDVHHKDGLLYVSLSDDLLYKPGSSKLGENGKKALNSLANVLNQYPKLKVIVLGNTDDVKFKKGSDNWTLSTERANGVVRTLRDDYMVDPSRLTSAGKGKYNPVADNSTEEGRARNRRTDIILNPDFDRLWTAIRRGER